MRGSARLYGIHCSTFVLIAGLACTGSITDPLEGAGGSGSDAGANGTGSTPGAAPTAGAGTGASPGTGSTLGTATTTSTATATSTATSTSTGVTTGTGAGTGASTGASTGTGTGTGTEVVDPAAAHCAASNRAVNAGLTPARRLTRHEFNNTIAELLGASPVATEALSDDERIGPFYSNAIAPITELQVQQYSEVAAKLASAAKARMAQISPCDLTTDTGTSTACATRFITAFGQRAYRRPLTPAEATKYASLYSLGRQAPEGAANGFRLVVEAVLQSPYFLYRYDVGSTGTVQPGTVPVTAWEMASRLSYFLWNSMPDDTLFSLAANGTLTQEATITTQVQRLLADPRAAKSIAMFHRQWLDIGALSQQPKDPVRYPQFTPALAAAMLEETALFTNSVIRSGDGLLKTLLTSNTAFPQAGLFDIYGVPQPAGYEPGTPVTLDASRRAGLFTQAAFLTRWAHADQTSPVHRGRLIRLNVLCGTVPPPPDNANTTPLPPSAVTSTRERFAQHSSDPTCGGCHQLMDPIGLGFEHYDSVGAYRTMDGLGAVDATGNLVAVAADLAGSFNGALELANKLAQSREVANCFSNQWFRFALGRMESTNDSCSILDIHDKFRASGGNIRELMAQIAMSPSFRNVRLNGG